MEALTPIKITIYWAKIQTKDKALKELYNSMHFIKRIPDLADPEKLTPAIKAELEAKTARLEDFILQTEQERDELVDAHHAAIAAGQYKNYEPGGEA